jgi:hypothetical protein
MKVEVYGSQDMLQEEFCSIAGARMKVPLCGQQKLQFYKKLYLNSTKGT